MIICFLKKFWNEIKKFPFRSRKPVIVAQQYCVLDTQVQFSFVLNIFVNCNGLGEGVLNIFQEL